MPNQRVNKSQQAKKNIKTDVKNLVKNERTASPQEENQDVLSNKSANSIMPEFNPDAAEGSRDEIERALQHDEMEHTDNKTIH